MWEPAERAFAEAVEGLANANPFRPHDVQAFERRARAADLPARGPGVPAVADRPGIGAVVAKAETLITKLADDSTRPSPGPADRRLHGELVRFVHYFRFRDRLQAAVDEGFAKPDTVAVPWYDEFRDTLREQLPRHDDDPLADPAHVFAGFFQIRRAFHLVHSQLVGTSRPMQSLRAAAWESVFTADLSQYGRRLFDCMQDVSTLIVGPSGTGKELVARAIGLSRYIPFDARHRRFAEPFAGAFHAVNLSALSPTLVESELFGHAKSAFTGAVAAREGWLEASRDGHAVFLDEIGELDPAIQVKLLRVLQERTFQRLGETKTRRFDGKVIAATNRDLDEEMRTGRFREDFYYRLCSDVVRTPSLRAQLDDAPGDLDTLVETLVTRQVGQPAPELVDRVTTFVRRELPDHAWPGNVRELEQCVRSVLVHGRYEPTIRGGGTTRERFAKRVGRDTLTADELLTAYCRVLYDEIGTYVGVAKVLDLDRRTVQRRVESD